MFEPDEAKINQARELISAKLEEHDAYALHSLGVGGSFAYGTAHAESDLDIRGIYSMGTDKFLMGDAPKVIQISARDLDIVLWEITHFCRLALGCNPNLLEYLWLPQYIYRDNVGLSFDLLRASFLSAPAIRSSFGGFAKGQIRRAQKQANDEKLYKHAVRSLLGALDLLEKEEFHVRLPDEHRIVVNGIMLLPEEIRIGYIETLVDLVDSVETSLPDVPSRPCVVNMLRHLRLDQLQDS